MNRKKKILIILFSFLIFGFMLFYSSALLQESNGGMIIMKSITLMLTGEDIQKIPNTENQYITRTQGGADIFKRFMAQRGFICQDQMGAGHIFISQKNQRIIVVSRQFTRRFTLWKINFK